MNQPYQTILGTSSREIELFWIGINQSSRLQINAIFVNSCYMNESPNLYDVQARRAEIKTELATVREREKTLASEDRELEIAERVLLRLAGTPEVQVPLEEALGTWKTAEGWN